MGGTRTSAIRFCMGVPVRHQRRVPLSAPTLLEVELLRPLILCAWSERGASGRAGGRAGGAGREHTRPHLVEHHPVPLEAVEKRLVQLDALPVSSDALFDVNLRGRDGGSGVACSVTVSSCT